MTQADIARRLGIHQTTVSAVLRGDSAIYVADETRRRILETAMRAGYPMRKPSSGEEAANVPHNKGSGILGVVSFSNPIASDIERLRQTVHAIGREGYRPLVADAGWVGDGGTMACDTLIRSDVEGVIFCGVNDFFDLRLVTAFHRRKMPVVALSAATVPGALTLAGDREAGFGELVHHLAATGRRRLWLSTFPPSSATGAIAAHDAQLSVADGFEKAVGELGLEKSCRVVRTEDRPGAGFSYYEFGRRAMRAILSERKSPRTRPEAVLCFNDSWAQGAMHACWEAGVRVPEDIALTGYGGEAYTAYTIPPLTTIEIPYADLAQLAVARLTEALDSRTRSLHGVTLLPGKLLARASTGSSSPAHA